MSFGRAYTAFAWAMVLLVACTREDEAVLRERLDRWFALGETVSFHANQACAAGAFRARDFEVKATLSVAGSPRGFLRVLDQRGVGALQPQDMSPDAALIEMVTADRPTGMAVRRAALEGRKCMDDKMESAFFYALQNPRALLAYDRESAMVMMLDPQTGLIFAAMGAARWDV